MKKRHALVWVAAMANALFAMGCWSTYADERQKAPPAGREGSVTKQTPQNSSGVVDVGPTVKLEEAVKKLEKGKTTMEEALALLGQPQVPAMMSGPSGGLTLMYHWRKQLAGPYTTSGGQNLAMALAGSGPFGFLGKGAIRKANEKAMAQAAAIQNSFQSLTLVFNDKGVLTAWVSHPLMITPKQPPTDGADEKEKKAEIPPLAAVTPPR